MTGNGPGWELERATGWGRIAGCDEAGRGPLAGPVVAAAVILPAGIVIPGLNDSKQLSETQRLACYHRIREVAPGVGVGLASPAEIDRLNILRASLLAMRRAVAALDPPPEGVLVDGNRPIDGLALPQQAVVKGDARSVSVAAASVIAKVTRDEILKRLDHLCPGYGLAGHKGYPAPGHLAALRALGPTFCHRLSFGPVRALVADPPPLPPARSRGATAVQLSLFGDG